MIGLGGIGGIALAEGARMKQQEVATKRGILAAELEKERLMRRRKKAEQKYTAQEKSPSKETTMSSSMFLMADFAVPMWKRALIEAKEGIKTLKGVGKDLVTKKAWSDPKKNKQWTENMGQGFSEARNRVKQSLRKANDANIEKELMKNKSLDLQVDKMRQAAKKKYAAGGVKELAPLSRQEPDGLLQVDKRFGIGKKAKK
jgi:hypothetical protein